MQVGDIIVEYRDVNLNRIGQIPSEDLSIKLQPVRNGVGSWSLQLPAEHAAAQFLRRPGSGIVVTNVKTGDVVLSGPTSRPSSKRTSEDTRGMVSIGGVTDECVLFDALSWPSPAKPVTAQGDAYDIRSGAAETVIRAYVNANVGSAAYAGRRSLLAQRLTLATDQGRGYTVKKSARFVNLGELAGELATVGGLLFRVVQRGSSLVLEFSTPVDRSAYVRLDVENGTLDEQSIETSPPTTTRVVIAGQGEGAARTIVSRTNATATAAETQWGRVMEVFKDQRNTDDLAELQQSGDEILADEGFTKLAVKAVPSNDVTMVYGRDWNLGDTVSVVIDDQETRSTVTEAAIILDSSGITVGAAIGDVTNFDAAAALKSSVTDNTRRVETLERTVGTINISNYVQPGTIIIHAGQNTSSGGYLVCNGSEQSRAQYPDLFAVIGTRYGAGDGSTTFNVPDLRGRVVVGQNTEESEFNTVGKIGGAKTHTLSTAEMPSHTHVQNSHNHTQNAHNHFTGVMPNGGPYGVQNGTYYQMRGSSATTSGADAGNSLTTTAVNQATTAVNQSTGGGGAHNNLQPFMTLRFLIKT